MPTKARKARLVTHTALYLAVAIVLPVAFHSLGIAGRVFLPMHFPILLAGFLAGPVSGLITGLLAPSLSYLLTGMPPSYAVPLMTLELAIYGLMAGLTYYRAGMNIYVSLILVMIIGRLMFGLGLFILGMFMSLPYSTTVFFSSVGPIGMGLPGIVLQILLVPITVAAINRGRRNQD